MYHSNKLDAQARKEEHLRKSIEHLKSRGKEHNDVSAASAAKSKEKKLERASKDDVCHPYIDLDDDDDVVCYRHASMS